MEGWTTPAGTDPARDTHNSRPSRVRNDASAEIHLMLLNGIMEEDLIGQLALSRRVANMAFISPTLRTFEAPTTRL